jgi:hypothetical protein
MDKKKPNPNEPKWIIDPKDVKPKEEQRIRNWAHSVMKKNESKLSMTKYPDKRIVTRGEVKPEDIDISHIYPFQRLNWYIYREGNFWGLRLMSKKKILANFLFAKI